MKKATMALVLSAIGLCLSSETGCAADSPPAVAGDISLAPIDKLTAADSPFVSGDTIVFLGDSITQYADGDKGFISLFRAAFAKRPDLHINIYNRGIVRQQVPDLQERFVRDVIEEEPSVVFIYIGINDVWHWQNGTGTTVQDYEAGLRDMIGRLQQRGIIVVLATPSVIGEKHVNPMDQMLDQYADISRKVATDMQVEICDLRKTFKDYLASHNPHDLEKGVLTVDGAHLNDQGNALVAATAASSLVEALHRQSLTPVIPTWDFIGSRQNSILLHQAKLPDGLTLHYTTDGSEPTLQSPVYSGPIMLTTATTIAARTFLNNAPQSPVVKVTANKIIPEQAVKVPVQPGLIRHYYEVAWDKEPLPLKVPDFPTLNPIESKVVPTFEVPPAPGSKNYGLRFEGYLQVNETGIYGFRVGGNHAVLLLDGKRICFCNDEGKNTTEFITQVALEKGLHPIEFWLAQEATGGLGLYLEIRPPHYVDIHEPRAAELFHKAE